MEKGSFQSSQHSESHICVDPFPWFPGKDASAKQHRIENPTPKSNKLQEERNYFSCKTV